MEPSLIHQAAKDGELPVLSKASKKDLNRGDLDGWTAVHWCAWAGHPEPLEVVLKRGGHPNKPDLKGCTPLHVAATYGNHEAIELLIEHKSNIWALDNRGFHAAKVAALNKRLDCCRILDNLAIHLQSGNPDYVKHLQMKAVKELEKRLKENRAVHTKGRRFKHLTEDGYRQRSSSESEKGKFGENQTFVLQKPNEQNDDEKETDDFDIDEDFPTKSAKNTLRPLPRMTSGAILNTLSELAKRPMNYDLPDELQSTSSDPTQLQRSHTHVHSRGPSKAIASIIPIDSTEFEIENDSSLATFLHSVDVYESAVILLQEKMDMESLMMCSEEDLKSIGVALGPRKKIMSAISRRTEAIKSPGPMMDTDL